MSFIRNQRLYATAETSNQVWEVSSPQIVAGQWSYIEVSYHPLSGLSLYLNNELAGEDMQPRQRTPRPLFLSAQPQHFFIPFEELIGRDRVAHPVLFIRLADQPQLVPGKVRAFEGPHSPGILGTCFDI